VELGYYRVRVLCKKPDQTTTEAASAFLTLVPNGEILIGPLTVEISVRRQYPGKSRSGRKR
jgi:hypothetical protein